MDSPACGQAYCCSSFSNAALAASSLAVLLSSPTAEDTSISPTKKVTYQHEDVETRLRFTSDGDQPLGRMELPRCTCDVLNVYTVLLSGLV